MKDLHICGAGNLQASRALLSLRPVGYHEKSRASSTRSERRRAREWPIEISLSRLCRAARSRVLSRSLLRLPLEMESLLVGYVADREIDFPCLIIFEGFFGD